MRSAGIFSTILKNTDSNAEKQAQYFLSSLSDLIRRYEDSGRVFFTAFIDENEYSSAALFLKNRCVFSEWGGRDGAGRKVIAVGECDRADFPIVCLEISVSKTAREFSHRDVLGSLMSLGADRSVFGDIIVSDGRTAFVFCLSRMVKYVCENLTYIAGDSASVREVSPENIPVFEQKYEDFSVSVASGRLDCFVSAFAKVSREKAKDIIADERVFINGICRQNAEKVLSEGDTVTVRGIGKFVIDRLSGTGRKGKLQYKIRKFI